MSRDKFGPLVRALERVPRNMLGLLLSIANDLKSPGGEKLYSALQPVVAEHEKQMTIGLPRRWREGEEDNTIYFSVTSLGMSGEGWIELLECQGYSVYPHARRILCSGGLFSSGITTEIAIVRGTSFSPLRRDTKHLMALARTRDLVEPRMDTACLIRELFSDAEIQAMGLSMIVVMHRPAMDMDGGKSFLVVGQESSITTRYADPNRTWIEEAGFAYVVSPVPQQETIKG